ncbi:hypothetical protein BLA23254_06941 [Burkholderia lata]|uniref:Lipoprotein n=1 Tax=Burkholderia lata (strain ATCC 17760 / DSM 23089 / LMG 22485 / NCIMB 9086 / R18194 / 383) TaxID=482957 RepID=A0A6P2S9C7_BURL3|nr:hypothetical protein [Burkholderia lata]VWC40632.1 hypothetical protein BLA23254_06941 [Burkholderia lata]
MRAPIYTITVAALLTMLAACGQHKADADNQKSSEAKPVADPIKAAHTYYDGTDAEPWLALNKACKGEIAGGSKGVNCDAHTAAMAEAEKLIRANPAGFVGLRVRLK